MAPVCRLCGVSTRPAPHLEPLPFNMCPSCGFTFRDDLAAESVHDTYESGSYTAVRGTEYTDPSTLEARRRHARVRLDYVAAFASTGTLLDVGAAGGAFVEQAIARGYAAEGLEPTPAFAAFARDALRVPVRETTVEEAGLAPGSLDLVTMWHVLEHIPDPLQVLRELAAATRVGGCVAVEVPNAGGHQALKQGASWPSLEPAVHVNQFHPKSIRTALEAAGFEVVRVETVTITPYLTHRERWGVGHLVHRAKSVRALRSASSTHPSGHELLRAVARRA